MFKGFVNLFMFSIFALSNAGKPTPEGSDVKDSTKLPEPNLYAGIPFAELEILFLNTHKGSVQTSKGAFQEALFMLHFEPLSAQEFFQCVTQNADNILMHLLDNKLYNLFCVLVKLDTKGEVYDEKYPELLL
jgi:hypothetical protein